MEKQIALRKSIRHYNSDALTEAAQTALASWRNWAKQYTDSADADCDMRLLPGDAPLKGLYIVKAPGYMVFLGRPTRIGRINAGFVLEQISLRRLNESSTLCSTQHIARLPVTTMRQGWRFIADGARRALSITRAISPCISPVAISSSRLRLNSDTFLRVSV